ncbi:uncharacterized protein LOC127649720 [Xyrauchen texanus]|uniref:uncharacterized protein LOC127649720 n=1 Tax=Xyrauchen texanus TaxID=154827 RepID=UPI002242891B|nr:uncharacterized protein LOC127649720 [Xyrauchen texanus]
MQAMTSKQQVQERRPKRMGTSPMLKLLEKKNEKDTAFVLLASMSSKKDYLRYVVLHFIEHNEVEVAPSSWLELNNEVLYCYWPHVNAGIMVKKCAIPDKKLWSKHQVRIFSDTDNYGLARFWARKAQETSHVEDSDENRGRKVIPPRRFREEEVLPSQPRWAKQAQSFHENGGSDLKLLRLMKFNLLQHSNHSPVLQASRFKLFDGLERRILLKLDQIHADIKTAIGLQSVNQQSTSALDQFEVLEEPCKSVEELEELCEKLKAVEFRKIVCAEKMLFYVMLQFLGTVL